MTTKIKSNSKQNKLNLRWESDHRSKHYSNSGSSMANYFPQVYPCQWHRPRQQLQICTMLYWLLQQSSQGSISICTQEALSLAIVYCIVTESMARIMQASPTRKQLLEALGNDCKYKGGGWCTCYRINYSAFRALVLSQVSVLS